ncbi:unnamed protein product, partial [Ectocarpus sp. 12 AP-2014]
MWRPDIVLMRQWLFATRDEGHTHNSASFRVIADDGTFRAYATRARTLRQYLGYIRRRHHEDLPGISAGCSG